MAAEAGHAPNRVYIDQNGDFHLNGAKFFNTAETDIGASNLALNGIDLSAQNIVTDTSTGTKIGTGATQKLGAFGATPIVQPSGAAQGASSQTQAALTDSSTGAGSTTLAAMTGVDGTASNAAPLTATKNAVASLAARLAEVRTDVAAVVAEVNALRTALVNLGWIKGSA